MNFARLAEVIKPCFWRLVFTALGFAASLSFLLIGFWETTLILICCGFGCAIGTLCDKNLNVWRMFLKYLDRRE